MNTEQLKTKLEQEQRELEQSLAEVGRLNPQNKNDWETTPVPNEGQPEMHDEVADFLEDLNEREATEEELEKRLESVKQALIRLNDGTYGQCRLCQQAIEPERLAINPTAETCKLHRGEI